MASSAAAAVQDAAGDEDMDVEEGADGSCLAGGLKAAPRMIR